MECRLERGNQRDVRQLFRQQSHGVDVRRIVSRRDLAHFLHGFQYIGGDLLDATDTAPMDRLKADGRHLAGVL